MWAWKAPTSPRRRWRPALIWCREGYRSHKLKPYRKAAQAEQKLEKANVNALYQKSLQENPPVCQQPLLPLAAKTGHQKGSTPPPSAPVRLPGIPPSCVKTGKAAKDGQGEKAQQAGRLSCATKGLLDCGAFFLLICLLLNTMSSCSMMAQSIGSVVSGTTYPSDDPELVAVEADYAPKKTALQAEIDNIESSHPGYDEYRYDLDMIGHDPP